MLRDLGRKLRGNTVVALALRADRGAPSLPRRVLEARRDRRIRAIVRHAALTVPYYRDWFAREGIDPRSITGAEALDRLPTLDRELVRERPERFLSEGSVERGSLSFRTSGTTGTPLEVHHDGDSLLANLAFGEREREPVLALCGGGFRPKELYVGYESSTFKKVQAFYLANTFLPRPRRRFASLREPFAAIVDLVVAERPDVIVGYGGWIELFFRRVVAEGIDLPRPKVVVWLGEALPYGTRELLEESLRIPVLSRYNAVEAFKIGFLCERRTGFHLHEDLCHVRVDDRDETGEGRLVLSNLVNRATVLLNYPIGDRGSFSDGPCPCGRTLRQLARLEGRVEDVLVLADGRSVHPRAVWEIFKDDADVLQYRLVQEQRRRFSLEVATLGEDAFARVIERSRPRVVELLGADVEVCWSRRSDVDRARETKFRAVESRC